MVNEDVEHLAGYQARDFEVVDYQLFQLVGTELKFRGPAPQLREGEYVSCLGAAQTFGCLVERPYPQLLAAATGTTMLNLGYGGAGPRFFNRHSELLGTVNRGRMAIVQVMSGRSEDNSRFESRGLEYLRRRSDGKPMSADAAWRSVLECRYAWRRLPLGQQLARKVCQWFGRRDAERLLEETRRHWVASYQLLLQSIQVPVILLWFSKRPPEFQESYTSLQDFMGVYPQLVNREMLEAIRPFAEDYVECVTQRGSPQPLTSRFDGKPVSIDLGRDRQDFAGQTWEENQYYPSPEMHEDACQALLPRLAGRENPS